MLKRRVYSILIILIIILGSILRLYKLGVIPFGFFCDEASVGYNSYSLLSKGVDEWGKNWPIFFRAFGEFKGPVMIYSTIPFVYFLGLNQFSVRLVSAIFGIATIIAIYLLGKQLFNRQTGILSAFFLAISPWHIHFSRVSLEGLTPFVFFTVLATYFWLKFIKDKKFGYLSILFFSFAFYSYFPARIFIPLFFLSLFFLNWNYFKTNSTQLIKFFIFGLLLISPMIFHLVSGEGLSRWQQVKGDLTPFNLTKKYFDYFSTSFLFFQGDVDFPGQFITRHSVKGIGELHLIQFPFIIFSLYFLFKNKFKKDHLILFFWLFFYPFCDLFTSSISPQATRSIIGVIPFQILTAFGLYQFVKYFNNKIYKNIIVLIVSVLTLLSLYNYQKLYFQKYSLYSSDYWGWQSGPERILSYFKIHQQDYDQLCLEGNFNSPDIFIKFYDPQNLCHGKCQICSLNELSLSKKQLFAISPETYNQLNKTEFITKQIIKYPNYQPAFYLVSLVK